MLEILNLLLDRKSCDFTDFSSIGFNVNDSKISIRYYTTADPETFRFIVNIDTKSDFVEDQILLKGVDAYTCVAKYKLLQENRKDFIKATIFRDICENNKVVDMDFESIQDSIVSNNVEE